MTTGVYQSDNFRPNSEYVEEEKTGSVDTNEDTTTEDRRDAENLGLDVDVIVRNSENYRDGQGQGRGQNGENISGLGDLGLEEPKASGDSDKGRTVYEKIVMMLFAYAKNIMDRRADRLEQMEKISHTLTDLAEQQSEKFIEKTKEAQEKQKTGILGKIFAILGLILAVVVAAFTVAAAPFTGGLSLTALTALLPSMLAIAGVAFAGFAAGDALFNDSKLTNKIMEETIGKLMEALTNLLKKAGLSDKAAQGIAIGIIGAVMIAFTVLVAKSMHMMGNFAIKAQQNMLKEITEQSAKAATTAAVRAGGVAGAASAGSNAAQGTTNTVRAGTLAADQAEEVAKATKAATAAGKTDTAADSGQAAKTGSTADDAVTANGTVKVETADAGTDIGTVIGQPEKLERMAKFNRMSFRFQVAESVNDLGTVTHRNAIAIINAQLEMLMAEDQADIDKLKAIMKIIENILAQHDQFSEEDVKQYEAAMQQLAKFIIEQMPSISRPVVRVHPA